VIDQLVTDFFLIQDAMVQKDVSDLMKPYADAIDADEQVPQDVHREVTNFRAAQKALYNIAIPQARRWVHRKDAADQTAAELEQHLAQLMEAPRLVP
jgi:hypothetical protein